MKTILPLLLFVSFASAQTVTPLCPTSMQQVADTYPWTETYADCMQTNAPSYVGSTATWLKTIGARCVGPNPPAGTDCYYDVGEYLPWVLIAAAPPTATPWNWFLPGWEQSFVDTTNYAMDASTHFGTRAVQHPYEPRHETLDDYRFVIPAWTPGLSGTSWVVQFMGLRPSEWVFSSGVLLVYS